MPAQWSSIWRVFIVFLSHLLPLMLFPLPERGGSGVLPTMHSLGEGHDFRKQEKSDVAIISSFPFNVERHF